MEFIIEKDQTAILISLHQFYTYEGLYAGLPTEELNEKIMSSLKNLAKKIFYIDGFYLIPPEQTPIPYSGEYRHGKPSGMPPITCLAKCYSGATALTIAWYQDNFAFPIDAEILEKIKEIPWSEVAGETDWG